MPTFVITAHIELTGIGQPIPPQQPIQTGLIRMAIPADDIDQARTKARKFINGKMAIVIDSSIEQPVEQPTQSKSIFEVEGEMGDIIKNWPFKS